MKHTIMICDRDRQYAEKAAGYINSKDGFPFDVRVSDSLTEVKNVRKGMSIDIVLIDEDMLEQSEGYMSEMNLIVLSGKSLRQSGNNRVIYKYQSVDGIVKEILLYASSRENLKNLISRKSSMKVIGMFSPIGRSGQTSIGLAIGQSLARNHRTLFVSMDCYRGISSDMFTIPCQGDLSDLLYSVNNDSKDIAALIGGASGSIGGLDVMPSMDRHNDLISITYPEWRNFLRHIEDNTDYEYVILDMTKAVQGLTELIALCHKVLVTIKDEDMYRERLEGFKKEIEAIDDIGENIRYINIPSDNDTSVSRRSLESNGKIAECAKDVVREIVT